MSSDSKYEVQFDATNGILKANIREKFDKDDVHGFIKEITAFPKDKQYLFLAILGDGAQAMLDKDVRDFIGTEAKKVYWGKIAIVGAKPVLRMIGKILLAILGKGNDSKFFDNEEKAIDWLKE